MTVKNDKPLLKLEHDHLHLSRVVADVRCNLQATVRGERSAEALHELLLIFLEISYEDLFEHFNREEEALFPWIVEQVPEMSATIDRLENAHDRMCGVILRMQQLISQGPAAITEHLDKFLALFGRFDAYFIQHAEDERALLDKLREILSDAQRATIAELLAQI